MRSLSATDNRLPRARPPLRPNALAISDAFMAYILLSAKHKVKQTRTVQLQSSINCERAVRPRPNHRAKSQTMSLWQFFVDLRTPPQIGQHPFTASFQGRGAMTQ